MVSGVSAISSPFVVLRSPTSVAVRPYGDTGIPRRVHPSASVASTATRASLATRIGTSLAGVVPARPEQLFHPRLAPFVRRRQSSQQLRRRREHHRGHHRILLADPFGALPFVVVAAALEEELQRLRGRGQL